jgi:hypothetical protein
VSVPLYFDVHVRRVVADELRRRGVDVLTAQEDNTTELEDSRLLDRATQLGRLLFTQDRDFLREATRRQRVGGEVLFGIVYAHQLRVSISDCIRDLEIIAKNTDPEDWIDCVQHLPL